MKELVGLTSAQVKDKLTPIEKKDSYVDFISEELSQHVFGQPEASYAVAQKLAIADSGLHDGRKPLAAFLEIGPTGVGKTEMAKATAKLHFGKGWEERIKIVNCAELSDPHTISRLIGSPPGYVGYGDGLLIPSKWLDEGRSVVVFDEIEKGSRALHRLLLSVVDEGRVYTREGSRMSSNESMLDFSRSFVFMTSNAGSEELVKKGATRIGFGEKDTKEDHLGAAKDALKKHFAPEFLGRVDIIQFHKLEPHHFKDIYWKQLEERNNILSDRFKGYAPYITTTSEFQEFVLSQIDTDYGARSLNSLLERELYAPASNALQLNDVLGKVVVADREDEETHFYTTIDEREPACETDEP